MKPISIRKSVTALIMPYLAWLMAGLAHGAAKASPAVLSLDHTTFPNALATVQAAKSGITYSATGRLVAGDLRVAADDRAEIRLAIDLRTFDFAGSFELLGGQIFRGREEDPVMVVKFSAQESLPQIVTVSWRGRQQRFAAKIQRNAVAGASGYQTCQAEFMVPLETFGVELSVAAKPLFKAQVQLKLMAGFLAENSMPRSAEWSALSGALSKFWLSNRRPVNSAEYWLTFLATADCRARALLQSTGADMDMIRAIYAPFSSGEKYLGYEYDEVAYRSIHDWGNAVAASLGASELTTEHAFIALVENCAPATKDVLARAGVSPGALRQALCRPLLSATRVELLGNPAAKRHRAGEALYARNVWALQPFGGRLYPGQGNSSNAPPAMNAGPVDVWHYDPASGSFDLEGTLEEEQIDRFVEVGGQLWVPGHDPRESWEWGNIHRQEGGKWAKYRNVPDAVHIYDIGDFQGVLYAALGVKDGAALSVSTDRGASWKNTMIGSDPKYEYRSRAVFPLGGQVMLGTNRGRIYAISNDGSSRRVDYNLFPGTKPGPHHYPARITAVANRVVYLGFDSVNDHQGEPFGLFVADAPDQFRAVKLPATDRPYDILAEGKDCWILTNALSDPLDPASTFHIAVWHSDDLQVWREIFRFESGAFARSFARINGDFYFGLGCSTFRLSEQTGNILRVRDRAWME